MTKTHLVKRQEQIKTLYKHFDKHNRQLHLLRNNFTEAVYVTAIPKLAVNLLIDPFMHFYLFIFFLLILCCRITPQKVIQSVLQKKLLRGNEINPYQGSNDAGGSLTLELKLFNLYCICNCNFDCESLVSQKKKKKNKKQKRSRKSNFSQSRFHLRHAFYIILSEKYLPRFERPNKYTFLVINLLN